MVFVIAECGINWRNLKEADRMIREAANAGVQACKFQAYQTNQIEGLLPDIYEHCKSIMLTPEDMRYLYYRCQQHGVEFMCTPMYPEAVFILDPLVKRWKIRFADRDNEAILYKCKETGKPLLISGKNIFCFPEYPPIKSDQLYCGKGFGGFSSHYPNIQEPLRIMQVPGFEYLEVHVMLDEYVPDWVPPDIRVSISMSELAELCRRLK